MSLYVGKVGGKIVFVCVCVCVDVIYEVVHVFDVYLLSETLVSNQRHDVSRGRHVNIYFWLPSPQPFSLLTTAIL